MNKHRELRAWQACRLLIRAIYRITRHFPADERYGLTSQLRRAAVSSASNIAEGQARTGMKEAAHGASVGLGSLAEVDTLLAVAEDEQYVSAAELEELDTLRTSASQLTLKLLQGLRRRLKEWLFPSVRQSVSPS